ncbi:MAG TPA: hypothetical protein VIH49_04720 [Solirubrobacteraceae bacterium]
MSARIATTISMNLRDAIIFSSHARTAARSGAYGEVIGDGVVIVWP